MFVRVRAAVRLFSFFAALSPVFSQTPALQSLAHRAVQSTLERFAANPLAPDQLALTLVDLRDPASPQRVGVRGGEMIYPASVIKLFYFGAAHRWMEDDQLTDTPELRRAMQGIRVRRF